MKTATFRRIVRIQANDDGSITPPNEVELLQTGSWDTPWHGRFEISADDLAEYMQHAKDGIRKGLPIDLEHNTIGGSVGWLGEGEGYDFEIRDNDFGGQSLWASVKWTKKGAQLLQDEEYRYFSPEFATEDYEDPEHAGDYYNNVLIGGGLTNRPLFKNLTAVAADDATQNGKKVLTANSRQNIIYLSEEQNTMDLQELLAKKTDELTAEEKAFIVEHKADLTDEQVTSLTEAGVLEAEGGDDNGGDGGSDDDAGAGAGDDDAGAGAGDDDAAGGDGGTQASEGKTVTISANELAELKANAAAGKQASDTLARKASEEHIGSLLFNEKNGGKLPIAAKDTAVDFYHGLNEAQRKQFNDLIEKMPNLKMFGELGSGGGTTVDTAQAEVIKKANDLMKEDSKLTKGSAIRKVLASDKELKARYEDERKEQGEN